MNAGHRYCSFDVRDPHWGDLLEANRETNVLNILAVDGADVQAEELLLGHIVPSNAGEVPSSVHNSIIVDGE